MKANSSKQRAEGGVSGELLLTAGNFRELRAKIDRNNRGNHALGKREFPRARGRKWTPREVQSSGKRAGESIDLCRVQSTGLWAQSIPKTASSTIKDRHTLDKSKAGCKTAHISGPIQEDGKKKSKK